MKARTHTKTRRGSRTKSSARVAQPLALALLALIPAQSYASECEQDSDCGAGWRCEVIEQAISTCHMDERAEDCEEIIESFGFCVELPIDCETDSDCPSHLRCGQPDRPSMSVEVGPVEPVDSDMSGSSSGGAPGEGSEPTEEMMTEEPIEETDMPPVMEGEPDEGPTMCVFVPESCESDADCAESFHCETVTYATPCGRPEPAPCPEGEECDFEEGIGDDCRDAEFTESFCAPDEIECDSDDMCPADWSCRQFTEYACEGGATTEGSTGEAMEPPASEGSTGDAPDSEDEEPIEEPTEGLEPMELPEEGCEELTRSLCVPAGLYGFGAADSAEIATSSPGSDFDREDDSSDPMPTAEPGDGTGSGSAESGESEESEESGESSSASASDSDDEGGCDARRSSRAPGLLVGLFIALISVTRRRLTA